MREPNLKYLKVDVEGTKKMRKRFSEARAIKITINIDKDSLTKLKKMSTSTGTPYQRLINQILKTNLAHEATLESRVEQLEREVKKLKGKRSA